MKTTTLLVAVVAAAVSAGAAEAQSDRCEPILRDGLYRYVLQSRSENFRSDLRTYFSSEVFREDFRNGRFSAGVEGITVDAVPISLSVGASDDDISRFQQSISQATALTLDRRFGQEMISAIPDADMAKAYVDCIVATSGYGFTTDVHPYDDHVVFTIRYTKRLSADPMPVVRRFSVIGARSVEGGPQAGDAVPDNLIITVLRYPENRVVLTLDTDREPLVWQVDPSEVGFNKEFPVGSVLSSALSWDAFSQITEDRPSSEWDAGRSKWAPADGRGVAASQFARRTGSSSVPDLRGVFLRGLNRFDPFESHGEVADEQKDPAGLRSAGSFQEDAVQQHTHTVGQTMSDKRADSQMGRTRFADFSPATTQAAHSTGGVSGPARHDNETRPKNVAIYYYIRIN